MLLPHDVQWNSIAVRLFIRQSERGSSSTGSTNSCIANCKLCLRLVLFNVLCHGTWDCPHPISILVMQYIKVSTIHRPTFFGCIKVQHGHSRHIQLFCELSTFFANMKMFRLFIYEFPCGAIWNCKTVWFTALVSAALQRRYLSCLLCRGNNIAPYPFYGYL